MKTPFIVDVGLHRGQDTAFYLQKGFDVVAIEANPDLAEFGRQRFREYIEAGRLRIFNVAIADHEGTVDCFACPTHDDWGTVSEEFMKRNESLGFRTHVVKVRATRLDTILSEFETPYYVKIDIEGADFVCLSAFRRIAGRPKFVSIEPSLTAQSLASEEFRLLQELGYTKYKIINQALHHTLQLSFPPREGEYVEHQFDGHSSGAFGEELPGKWLNWGPAWAAYRRRLLEQRLFGAGGRLFQTRFQRAY